jgi:hypothetical protein
MRQRLAMRTDNPYGKDPAQLQAVLADLEEVEPLLRASADAELDGTLPVGTLADAVELLARTG